MGVVVRALDDRRAGSAEDRRRVPVKLDLVDENSRARFEHALEHCALADRVLRKQLKAELQAVRHDALLLPDSHDDAPNRASAGHVNGDGHDAFRETELMHQEALPLGTSCESKRSTTVTASATAFATGSLSSMLPSFSGPKVCGSHPTMVTLCGVPPRVRTSANTESGVMACPWKDPSAWSGCDVVAAASRSGSST